MTLKDSISQVAGLRFVIEQTPILSAAGRRYLYATEWQSSADALALIFNELTDTEQIIATAQPDTMADIEHLICQTRDIEPTIDGLMSGTILGDIEFFEIKSFALIVERLRPLVGQLHLADIPSLAQVVDILDPERSRVAAFHIYDLYNAELAEVRAQLKQLNSSSSDTFAVDGTRIVPTVAPDSTAPDDAIAAQLYQRSLQLEDAVRKDLAFQLRPLARYIRQALVAVAQLDIRIAKIRVAERLSLTQPVITAESTSYTSLVNPQVADALRLKGKQYQPVDISFEAYPTLISGINMGGKTVCLKTLALAQTLCQFGFYVPAAEAHIALVDQVMLVVDDNQNELSGLSSFAGEMRQINDIIHVIRRSSRTLVLIDELARTTNPVEGRAIVEAMLQLLADHRVPSLVSSHYDHIVTTARRLRIKGLRDTDTTSDVDHLDRYIDYSLVEVDSADTPHEALRIARLIGIDPDFIDLCQDKLI